MTPRAVAEGFVRIAVDNMANAIKQISIARGHDVTRYTLQCFGGAGGQHACLVADALGIGTVMIHPLAGVLSAYGMGLADMVELRQRTLGAARDAATTVLAELEARGGAALARAGRRRRPRSAAARRCATRAATPASKSPVVGPSDARGFRSRCTSSRFGFAAPGGGGGGRNRDRRGGRKTSRPSHRRGDGEGDHAKHGGGALGAEPLHQPSAGPPPRRRGGYAVIDRAALSPGDHHPRPRAHHRSLRDHGGRTRLAAPRSIRIGNLILTRTAPRAAAAAIGTEVDPVRLEIFDNLFMAIAEEMGVALQRTRVVGQHQGAARFLLRAVRRATAR